MAWFNTSAAERLIHPDDYFILKIEFKKKKASRNVITIE